MNSQALSLSRAWFLLLCLAVLPAQAQDAAGYIARARGEVAIDGQSAARGATFGADATISTADQSYALLKFRDDQSLFLRANSTLKVAEYVFDSAAPEQSRSSVSLLKGGMRAVTGLIGKGNPAAVTYGTPAATIGIRGTELMVSIVRSMVFIRVLEGAIEFPGASFDGIETLLAGEDLALGITGAVIATGDEARSLAARVGAFSGMEAVQMDTGGSDSVRDWGRWEEQTDTAAGDDGDTGSGTDGTGTTRRDRLEAYLRDLFDGSTGDGGLTIDDVPSVDEVIPAPDQQEGGQGKFERLD